MKKLTLFVCVMAVSTAMFAAPFKKAVKLAQEPTIKAVEATWDGSRQFSKEAKAGIDSVQVPYRTYQPTFRMGKPSDGFSYDFYAQGLVSPFAESIIFFNDSMYPADWYINGRAFAENVAYINLPVKFGENQVPLMKIAGHTDTLVFDWQIAKAYVEKYWEGYSDFYSTLVVAPAEYTPITQCARYTEDPRQSEYGSDCYQVGAGSLGDYCYGTNTSNPWQNSKFDSLLVLFENPGVTNIDHITLALYTNASSYQGMFPGENDHVRLTVYPGGIVDKKMSVDWEHPIATTTANLDNFTPSTDQYGNPRTYGLLEFDFLEEDPVTGALTPAPIVVEGNYVILLDEYNDGTANFGIFSDYYANGVDCNTLFPWFDIAEQKQYYSIVFGQNILLNVVAYFPVFNAPTEVKFATGETQKQFEVASNVWFIADEEEDIEWDAPEWIDVEIETIYEMVGEGEDAYYKHTFVNKLTIKVEESSEKREGTIDFNAMGLEGQILVKQNDDTQAINNVKVVNDNKLYNVLGQEVSEDYKGVVIRNGEKFVR